MVRCGRETWLRLHILPGCTGAHLGLCTRSGGRVLWRCAWLRRLAAGAAVGTQSSCGLVEAIAGLWSGSAYLWPVVLALAAQSAFARSASGSTVMKRDPAQPGDSVAWAEGVGSARSVRTAQGAAGGPLSQCLRWVRPRRNQQGYELALISVATRARLLPKCMLKKRIPEYHPVITSCSFSCAATTTFCCYFSYNLLIHINPPHAVCAPWTLSLRVGGLLAGEPAGIIL